MLFNPVTPATKPLALLLWAGEVYLLFSTRGNQFTQQSRDESTTLRHRYHKYGLRVTAYTFSVPLGGRGKPLSVPNSQR